ECAELARSLRGALAEALLASGRHAAAGEHFERLLDEAPEEEAWHRGLMRCHAADGERALALRQFHACRSVLRQGPGVEPSPETEALYLELLRRPSAS
ncbi:MAG: AfsR/SARP family transcriptional regulator, partial [Miltoncostaeaceae bacterium]